MRSLFFSFFWEKLSCCISCLCVVLVCCLSVFHYDCFFLVIYIVYQQLCVYVCLFSMIVCPCLGVSVSALVSHASFSMDY